MTKPFPIHEAKARLSRLIERALAGETIIISRGKKPVVQLTPIQGGQGRKFGAMKGKVRVTKSFFEDLPDEELEAWGQ